jgi:putative ABC transport system permease protein
MFTFLLKGIIRDRHRSLFPIMVVTTGVWLTVFMNCWIKGVMGDFVDSNAKFSTGHVKVMTKPYAENVDQKPNDLALIDVNQTIDNLNQQYPEMTWVKRIQFGGLLDVPDENGETKSQGPAVGLAVDLFSDNSREIETLNIAKAIVRGRMPERPGEILISNEFAERLGIKPGEVATLLSSTMYGSMAMYNFHIAGTIQFGVAVMDRSAMIIDITDAQLALDMENAAGEILGYFNNNIYDNKKAEETAKTFNELYKDSEDEFAPVMLELKKQNDLAGMMDYMSNMTSIFIFIFVIAMSIVLWNSGLIGGLRRYGEIGVRLAIGENKTRIYKSMIYESIMIGFIGSLTGTMIGLVLSFLLSKGIDFSSMMKNSTMMIPSVYRTQITPNAFFIGFFPGLFSTVLGTTLSGIGIYKRQTAQLFKELEV